MAAVRKGPVVIGKIRRQMVLDFVPKISRILRITGYCQGSVLYTVKLYPQCVVCVMGVHKIV